MPAPDSSVPVPDPKAAPAGAPPSEPAPADALAAARKEAAENYERYLRASANLENFRRRAGREKEELRQFAAAAVLEDLIPVLDNLGLALAAIRRPEADAESVAGGIELVLQALKSALAAHGLSEIDPVGQPFDPHRHEAISHQPSAEVKEEHVLSVVRCGFELNGRLLRPASVVVSSGPAQG